MEGKRLTAAAFRSDLQEEENVKQPTLNGLGIYTFKRFIGIFELPTRISIQPFCHKLDNALEQVCLLRVC